MGFQPSTVPKTSVVFTESFGFPAGVALFHQRITMALTVIIEAEEVTQVIAAVKDR